ncbi:MAG: hypothetical protein JRS35_25895 [Deltaproteobacteria bacterium]|nr:hypothetical protein [Deltaproteobacteria bacterium]
MGLSAEVAEDVLLRDAAPEQLPGGHGRVEAAGKQRHRAALHAEGKAPVGWSALREEVGLAFEQFHVGGDLGAPEVYAGRSRQ